MNVIDLFAGVGGLSLGFIQNGFTVTKAVEFDAQIAQTFKNNHPNVKMIVDDIKNIDNSDNYVLDVDVGIPKDGGAINSTNTNKDVFNPNNAYFKS